MLDEMFSLHGKTTIVTGGAHGIGKAVAFSLAHAGTDIILFDVDTGALSETATELQAKTGRRVFSRFVDVTDEDLVQRAIDDAWRRSGPVELLFNNAGIVTQKRAIETSLEEWRQVIDVNLTGIFNVAKVFGKKLIENGRRGSIVNTGSMSAGIVNYPQLQASYNASKAGVVQLTKSLAYEWAEQGIRVNCISPGYISTELTDSVRKEWRDQWADLTPMKRLGRPEELASSVLYFLADSSGFTTGAELIVDGGFTIV